MTLIMTATPLSMHINDGYSLEETAGIIRSHVLGMYVPSLFSGLLIERLGTVRMMSLGALALLIATMLTLTYSMNERFKAQAVNEFTVFGVSATASLLAGTVIHLYGWYTLVIVPLPLLVLTLTSLFFVRRDPLVRRLAPKSA
jgi:hypothetical protein